jgi:hypothetical protein
MQRQISHFQSTAQSAAPKALVLLTIVISLYSLRYVSDVFSWGGFYALHPYNCSLPDSIMGKLQIAIAFAGIASCVIVIERCRALARLYRRNPSGVNVSVMLVIALLIAATMFMLESITTGGFLVDVIK